MEEGRRIVTVTELNECIKLMLENDELLTGLYVKGEISNFKLHTSGHLYFNLKDEGGVLTCVMFKFAATKLKFVPSNGMKVICGGRMSVYVRSGQYQLYVDTMEPDGIGALYIAYEQLKNKLTAEGLFNADKKRPLPKIPRRIGVITSPTGAAVRDIMNILGRRFPYAEVLLYPSLVQGDDAPPQLCRAMKWFCDNAAADVIIIGRGGGSLEDLWAFNDEALVRTVAASTIPVISAVGHETDFTLCDFAADKRAPTPSAAAELAVPDTSELKQKFANVTARLELIENNRLRSYRDNLARLASSRALVSPQNAIDDRRMALAVTETRLYDKVENIIQRKKSLMASATAKLDALNPLSVISRGYSAVFSGDGKLIKSVSQVKFGDTVSFKVTDGTVSATVTDTAEE